MAGRTVYEVWLAKYGKAEADKRTEISRNNSATASKKLWQDKDYRALIKDDNLQEVA